MRRYETDYAGVWRGHCKSRENAVIAATRHIMLDGYARATVTDKETGQVVARLSLADSKKTVTVTTETKIRKLR